jgi:hypothetical protein
MLIRPADSAGLPDAGFLPASHYTLSSKLHTRETATGVAAVRAVCVRSRLRWRPQSEEIPTHADRQNAPIATDTFQRRPLPLAHQMLRDRLETAIGDRNQFDIGRDRMR